MYYYLAQIEYSQFGSDADNHIWKPLANVGLVHVSGWNNLKQHITAVFINTYAPEYYITSILDRLLGDTLVLLALSEMNTFMHPWNTEETLEGYMWGL